MEEFKNLLLFLTMFGVGVLLEVVFAEGHYFFTKRHYKENHFTFKKYLFFLLFPILGLILLTARTDLSVVWAFVIFAVVGTILEWLIGFSYHMIVGQRLWTYHRFDIYKHTSWLSIPVWGFIGVVFYLIAQFF